MKAQNSYEESLQAVLAQSLPLGAEKIPFQEGLGRVLAADVFSQTNEPPAAISAMDGYCLQTKNSHNASPAKPVSLPFSEILGAGHLPEKPLFSGQACRIMTGAVLPPGADAVVKQEDVIVQGNTILLRQRLEPGENILAQGAHMEQGQRILSAGERITPQILGMLAKLGQAELSVHAQPRVAILAIGDELMEVGHPLRPGQLHVSNLYSMEATIRRDGGIPHRLGIAPDDPTQIEKMLRPALASESASGCEMVMTLGGSSKGDFDLFKGF